MKSEHFKMLAWFNLLLLVFFHSNAAGQGGAFDTREGELKPIFGPRPRITGVRPIALQPDFPTTETEMPFPNWSRNSSAMPAQTRLAGVQLKPPIVDPEANVQKPPQQNALGNLVPRVTTGIPPLKSNTFGSMSEHTADEAQAVPTVLTNIQLQHVTLLSVIHFSITSRRIFNSFRDGVVVEQLSGYDQEIAGQKINAELARFDPTLTANIAGNRIDRPSASFFGPGLSQTSRRDEGEFNARLSRVWAGGASTSIGYEPSLAYLFFPKGSTSAFNPTLSSDMVLRASQPLLRGRGAGVNLATVRIAETRLAQTRIQVEAAMQAQLRSIEQVYWLLHASHVQLKAVNEAIAAAQKTLDVANDRFKAERALYSDVARASVRLEDLFQQKLAVELEVQKSTLSLAQLVGLELNNSFVLVPTDTPEFRQPNFDANEITASAINNNLAVQARRAEITIRQNNLVVASNQLLPQFDALALHRTSGLDGDLGTSLQQMMSLEFNDFSLGLQYTQQLGFRQGKSQTQVARLELARETANLQAAERQVGFEILQLLNELKQSYARYESSLRQFEQAQKWVDIAKRRYEDPPINTNESLLVLLLDYQTATQGKIDAISQVAQALAEYNGNLAIVDEKRGMLLGKWSIQTAPSVGPFPMKAK